LIFVLAIPLIVFLIVFFIFSSLVKLYHEKLYDLLGNKKEENPFKKREIEVMSETCLTVAKAIKPDSEKNTEILEKLKEMFEKISDIYEEEK